MTKDVFYISSNSLPEGEKSVEAEWADEGWIVCGLHRRKTRERRSMRKI